MVDAGDGQAQPRGFVRQHEVVAAFGVERHAHPGEAFSQRLAVRARAEDDALGVNLRAVCRLQADAAVFAAGSGDAAVFADVATAGAQAVGKGRAQRGKVGDVGGFLVVDATVLARKRRFKFAQFISAQILAGKAERL